MVDDEAGDELVQGSEPEVRSAPFWRITHGTVSPQHRFPHGTVSHTIPWLSRVGLLLYLTVAGPGADVASGDRRMWAWCRCGQGHRQMWPGPGADVALVPVRMWARYLAGFSGRGRLGKRRKQSIGRRHTLWHGTGPFITCVPRRQAFVCTTWVSSAHPAAYFARLGTDNAPKGTGGYVYGYC